MKTNNRLRPRLEKTFQTTRNSNGILLKRGDNFGDFNFGSTIVLVFEAPDNLEFNFKSGDVIRLGQALCSLKTEKLMDNSSISKENEEDENLDDTNDQQLLIDTVALDAAIVDADTIADQQVISNRTNDEYEESPNIQD